MTCFSGSYDVAADISEWFACSPDSTQVVSGGAADTSVTIGRMVNAPATPPTEYVKVKPYSSLDVARGRYIMPQGIKNLYRLGVFTSDEFERMCANLVEQDRRELEFKMMVGIGKNDAVDMMSRLLGTKVYQIDLDLGPYEDKLTVTSASGGFRGILADSARLSPAGVLKVKRPDGGTVVTWMDDTKSHSEPHDGDEYRPLMGELVIAAKRVMSDPLWRWEPMLHAICDWLPYQGKDKGSMRSMAEAMRTLSKFASVAADILDVEAAQQEKEEAERKAAEEERAREASLRKEARDIKRMIESARERDLRHDAEVYAEAFAKAMRDEKRHVTRQDFADAIAKAISRRES